MYVEAEGMMCFSRVVVRELVKRVTDQGRLVVWASLKPSFIARSSAISTEAGNLQAVAMDLDGMYMMEPMMEEMGCRSHLHICV